MDPLDQLEGARLQERPPSDGAWGPVLTSDDAPAGQPGPGPPAGGPGGRRPWWPHALLAVAVLAVSSAGATFATMPEVPALTLAAWRLELTALLLAAGFAVQRRRMSPADRLRLRQSAGVLAGAG